MLNSSLIHKPDEAPGELAALLAVAGTLTVGTQTPGNRAAMIQEAQGA